MELINPGQQGQAVAAIASAPSLIFTGTQVSFGYQEPDARLAMDRLKKVLEQAGTSPEQAAYVRFYPLSSGLANQVKKLGAEFFSSTKPPAGALLQMEGLPSMDSGFAVDVVAAK